MPLVLLAPTDGYFGTQRFVDSHCRESLDRHRPRQALGFVVFGLVNAALDPAEPTDGHPSAAGCLSLREFGHDALNLPACAHNRRVHRSPSSCP